MQFLRLCLRHAGLLLALALSPGLALADAKCGGVTVPDHLQAFGLDLVRNGVGIRRATIFNAHVYVAALYLEKPTRKAEDVLQPDHAKVITLHFVRDVDTQEMVDALNEALEKNAGKEFAAAKSQMLSFEKRLPPLKEGTVITLAYRPGKGLEVSADGKSRGVETDEAFANLVFRAWVGPRPPDAGLKAGLLGAPCK